MKLENGMTVYSNNSFEICLSVPTGTQYQGDWIISKMEGELRLISKEKFFPTDITCGGSCYIVYRFKAKDVSEKNIIEFEHVYNHEIYTISTYSINIIKLPELDEKLLEKAKNFLDPNTLSNSPQLMKYGFFSKLNPNFPMVAYGVCQPYDLESISPSLKYGFQNSENCNMPYGVRSSNKEEGECCNALYGYFDPRMKK